MSTTDFGELENIPLREGWPNEATAFTPWLADNLDHLANSIGVSLEFEGREVAVEGFSADILARNPEDDRLVLIENQLEPSDHSHLGQILTYLTGLKANIVIWVAADFREPHLSAIHWLNEHVGEPFAFFAVKVRLVRIASSPLAPVFDVLAKPSGWDRQLHRRSAKAMSEIGEFRKEFWSFYSQRYPEDADSGGLRPGYARSNTWHHTEISEVIVSQYLAQREVSIYCTSPRGAPLENVFSHLEGYGEAIRRDLGVEIGAVDDRHAAVAYWRVDTRDRGNWESMANWLHERLEAYLRVIGRAPAQHA